MRTTGGLCAGWVLTSEAGKPSSVSKAGFREKKSSVTTGGTTVSQAASGSAGTHVGHGLSPDGRASKGIAWDSAELPMTPNGVELRRRLHSRQLERRRMQYNARGPWRERTWRGAPGLTEDQRRRIAQVKEDGLTSETLLGQQDLSSPEAQRSEQARLRRIGSLADELMLELTAADLLPASVPDKPAAPVVELSGAGLVAKFELPPENGAVISQCEMQVGTPGQRSEYSSLPTYAWQSAGAERPGPDGWGWQVW